MKYKIFVVMAFFLFSVPAWAQTSAEKIVKAAFDYWRGQASVAVVTMTIHRPDWQRDMTLKAWTRGESESLFVITSPAKDKGNGTLKVGKGMWIYNPKIQRTIKLPPSMMSQSWQGSDFSNNDIAKSDSLVHDYTHTINGEDKHEGKKVFRIKSMPKPDAPVIWGMITLAVREDYILLQETFYDEALKPVKRMTSSDLKMVDNRLFPMQWKMQKVDTPDEYTRLVYQELEFKADLPDRIFTLTNLKNPGR